MQNTSFHSYIMARKLANLVDNDTLLPVFASSSIEIYPYQIAAARFAMRSRHLKGCILCDEGSLGKTYEALLVAAQKWYEGKDRILLILPMNLVKQWTDKLETSFNLPHELWNNGDEIPNTDGIIVTTYDFAVKNSDKIAEKTWDLIIFDEADILSKPQNKTVVALKNASKSGFKLLLTPTPITMSIMDIYGLIHFIDETVLPDADEFYKRYFRKPENYPELTSWVSQFAFRTLKSQVTEYVNFTERIPLTLNYERTAEEKSLYSKVENYLSKANKVAYPQMDRYELTLMFYHTLSSSPQAFGRTLEGALSRIGDCNEKEQLGEVKDLTDSVLINGKMYALLSALKKCFSKLRQLQLKEKAIVFTDNRTTMDVLKELLVREGDNVLTNRDFNCVERFRSENFNVLIATDSIAKGLDMEFCPVVVNYDLLYNAVEMEQRISRCHRQGQKSDVLVINLLGKENLSDVRILELMNKRILQFDGIFGMSDEIVGNFDKSIDPILSTIRKSSEIEKFFADNLSIHKQENKQRITHTEDTLFTTFTKAIADKVKITPRYIENKSLELNQELWELTKWYFSGRNDYEIDDNEKTITLKVNQPPQLFYYWAGSRNRPYIGQKKYGVGQDFKPSSGKIVLTSVLARGIMGETACSDSGEIVVNTDIEPCEIGFYEVSIIANKTEVAIENILVGITQSGKEIKDDECRKIMDLSVVSYKEDGKSTSYWLRNATGSPQPHLLDRLVPTNELIQNFITKNNTANLEEIERIKLRAMRGKTRLEHSLDDIKTQIKSAKQELSAETGDRLKELTINKQLKLLENDLRNREQNLFFEQMGLEVAMEDEIEVIMAKDKLETIVSRQFVVKVEGENV